MSSVATWQLQVGDVIVFADQLDEVVEVRAPQAIEGALTPLVWTVVVDRTVHGSTRRTEFWTGKYAMHEVAS